MDTETGQMIVKRVSVPVGLEELMEGLVKEVLLKKPDDIYLFAARYFAHLLTIRDKVPVNKAKTLRSVQTLKQKSEKPINLTKTSKLSKQFSIRDELDSPIISQKPKMYNRNDLKYSKRRHTGPPTVIPNNQQLTIRRKYAKSLTDEQPKPIIESNNNNKNKSQRRREREESIDRNSKSINEQNNNSTLPILSENNSITKIEGDNITKIDLSTKDIVDMSDENKNGTLNNESVSEIKEEIVKKTFGKSIDESVNSNDSVEVNRKSLEIDSKLEIKNSDSNKIDTNKTTTLAEKDKSDEIDIKDKIKEKDSNEVVKTAIEEKPSEINQHEKMISKSEQHAVKKANIEEVGKYYEHVEVNNKDDENKLTETLITKIHKDSDFSKEALVENKSNELYNVNNKSIEKTTTESHQSHPEIKNESIGTNNITLENHESLLENGLIKATNTHDGNNKESDLPERNHLEDYKANAEFNKEEELLKTKFEKETEDNNKNNSNSANIKNSKDESQSKIESDTNIMKIIDNSVTEENINNDNDVTSNVLKYQEDTSIPEEKTQLLHENSIQLDTGIITTIPENTEKREKRTLISSRTIDDDEVSRILISSISKTENDSTSSTSDLNELKSDIQSNSSRANENIKSKVDGNKNGKEDKVEDITVENDTQKKNEAKIEIKNEILKDSEKVNETLSDDSLDFNDENKDIDKANTSKSVEKTYNLRISEDSTNESENSIQKIISEEDRNKSKEDNFNTEKKSENSEESKHNEMSPKKRSDELENINADKSETTINFDKTEKVIPVGIISKTESSCEKIESETIEEHNIKETTNEHVSLSDQKTDLDIPSIETDYGVEVMEESEDVKNKNTNATRNKDSFSPTTESTTDVKTDLNIGLLKKNDGDAKTGVYLEEVDKIKSGNKTEGNNKLENADEKEIDVGEITKNLSISKDNQAGNEVSNLKKNKLHNEENQKPTKNTLEKMLTFNVGDIPNRGTSHKQHLEKTVTVDVIDMENKIDTKIKEKETVPKIENISPETINTLELQKTKEKASDITKVIKQNINDKETDLFEPVEEEVIKKEISKIDSANKLSESKIKTNNPNLESNEQKLVTTEINNEISQSNETANIEKKSIISDVKQMATADDKAKKDDINTFKDTINKENEPIAIVKNEESKNNNTENEGKNDITIVIKTKTENNNTTETDTSSTEKTANIEKTNTKDEIKAVINGDISSKNSDEINQLTDIKLNEGQIIKSKENLDLKKNQMAEIHTKSENEIGSTSIKINENSTDIKKVEEGKDQLQESKSNEKQDEDNNKTTKILGDTKAMSVDNGSVKKYEDAEINSSTDTKATNISKDISVNTESSMNHIRAKKSISLDTNMLENQNVSVVDNKVESTESENNLLDRVAKNYVNYVNDRYLLPDNNISGTDEAELDTLDNETENNTESKSEELTNDKTDVSNIDSPKKIYEDIFMKCGNQIGETTKTNKEKVGVITRSGSEETKKVDTIKSEDLKSEDTNKELINTNDDLIKKDNQKAAIIGTENEEMVVTNDKINNSQTKANTLNIQNISKEVLSSKKLSDLDNEDKKVIKNTAEDLINSTLAIAQSGLIEHKVKTFLNDFIEKEKNNLSAAENNSTTENTEEVKKTVTTISQPLNGKRTTSFDSSTLHNELKKVEEESKFTSFKSSYNPFLLRKEIEKATEDNTHNGITLTSMNFVKAVDAVLKIQSAWRKYNKTRKRNLAEHNIQESGEELKKKINLEEAEKNDNFWTTVHAALVIQKMWRGFQTRKTLSFMKTKQENKNINNESTASNLRNDNKLSENEDSTSKHQMPPKDKEEISTAALNETNDTDKKGRIFSAESSDSVNTVIFNEPKENIKPKADIHTEPYHAANLLLQENLDYPTVEEEHLLDDYQSKLLDKISGKEEGNKYDDIKAFEKIISPRRIEDINLEQLKDEVHSPLIIKNGEKVPPGEKKLTKSLSSKLEILEEESSPTEEESNKEEDYYEKEDISNKDSENKSNTPTQEKVYTFCSELTPHPVEKKLIEGKPLTEFIETLSQHLTKANNISPTENQGLITASNNVTKENVVTEMNAEEIKLKKNIEANKPLHTGELHETLMIPLPTEVKNKLKDKKTEDNTITDSIKSSKATNLEEISSVLANAGIDGADLHDTVVVPIHEHNIDTGRSQPISVQLCQTSGQVFLIIVLPPFSPIFEQDAENVMTSPAPRTYVTGSDAGNAQDPGKADLHVALQFENGSSSVSPSESMESEKRRKTDGHNMEAQAATKIQAGFRGYQVRKQLKLKNGSSDMTNVKKPARSKMSCGLEASKKQPQKPEDIEEQSAVKIQAGIRGFLVRRRQKKYITPQA